MTETKSDGKSKTAMGHSSGIYQMLMRVTHGMKERKVTKRDRKRKPVKVA